MKILRIIGTLQRMDQMIRMQSTGNPDNFASRLGMSERSLYYYLSILKELGAPIRFSNWNNSYVYLEKGRIKLEYEKQEFLMLPNDV